MRRPCLGAWITGATGPRPPSSAQSPPPPGSLPCSSVRTALPQPVTGSGGSPLATSGDTAPPPPPTPAPFKPHRLHLPQLLSRRDGLGKARARLSFSARGPFAGVCPAPSSSLSSKDTPSAIPTLRAGATGSQAPAPAERGLGPGPPAPPPGRSRRGAKLTAALARVPHWLGRPAPARRQGYGQLPGRDRYCAGDQAGRRPRGSLGLCAETPECPRAAAPGGEAAPAWPLLATLRAPDPASNLLLRRGSALGAPIRAGPARARAAGSGQRALQHSARVPAGALYLPSARRAAFSASS